jgi:hypothetical protein
MWYGASDGRALRISAVCTCRLDLSPYQQKRGRLMEWHYHHDAKQWQATAQGWRAVIERWASYAEYSAWIAPLDQPEERVSANHLWLTMADAQNWCAAEIAARRGDAA